MSSSTNVAKPSTKATTKRTSKKVASTKKPASNTKEKKTAVRKRKSIPFYRVVSLCAVFVGLVLLATSLTHLAHGVRKITGDTPLLAWCLAIGIDAGIIVLKLATIAGEKKPVWSEIGKVVKTFLILSLAASAGLNILSYTDGKDVNSFNFWLCVGFGCFIPAMIWALSQIAAKLWLDGRRVTTNCKASKNGGPPRKRRGSRGKAKKPVEAVQMRG